MSQIKRFIQILRESIRAEKIFREKGGEDIDYKTAGPALANILSELGPTFIKLGQMLSLRPDIINPDLADSLRTLLDHGAPSETSKVIALFKKEIGHLPEEVYDTFEKKPFAVASLAQAHKATLKDKVIAVKVQKPGIDKVIRQDLALIKKLTSFLFLLPRFKKFKKMADFTVEEFSRWIKKELDYRLEALNIERMDKNFTGVNYFEVPKIEHSLSSERILSMKYIDGVSLNEIFNAFPDLADREIVSLRGVEFKRKEIIDHALNIVFKQMFEDGFFHADPHPGNIIITKQGKIALIDYGIVGVLQVHIKKTILEIFIGIMNRDVVKISNNLISLNEIDGHDPVAEIEARIRKFLDDWQSGSEIEMSTAEALYRLIRISMDSKIDLPYSMVIIGKTLLEYDGCIRKLDPSLDIIKYFSDIVEKKYGTDIMNSGSGNLGFPAAGLGGILNSLPENLRQFAKNLVDNGLEFSVHFGPEKKRN